MFKRLKLVTSQGNLVHEVTIPSFESMPEVVIWGQRLFKRTGKIEKRLPAFGGDNVEDFKEEYREVFYVTVVPIPGVDDNGLQG